MLYTLNNLLTINAIALIVNTIYTLPILTPHFLIFYVS